MTAPRWSLPIVGTALIALLSLIPPVRHGLEASMTVQMLVQIPVLILAGSLLVSALPSRLRTCAGGWDWGGVSGLVLATLVMAFWMLPRSLDASTTDPLFASAKFITVPLVIGLPLAFSWPRAGFVVRGVFLAEFVATFFRLGWVYRVSPIRLCNNYGIDDQQRLGTYMLWIGSALLAWLVWKLLAGNFKSLSPALPPKAPQ